MRGVIEVRGWNNTSIFPLLILQQYELPRDTSYVVDHSSQSVLDIAYVTSTAKYVALTASTSQYFALAIFGSNLTRRSLYITFFQIQNASSRQTRRRTMRVALVERPCMWPTTGSLHASTYTSYKNHVRDVVDVSALPWS